MHTGRYIAEDTHRPALFHFTTGKDRTGWATAATLLLLGVSDDVAYDYVLSSRDLLPALKPFFEQFRGAGGDPHLFDPVPGVEHGYLQAALDEMKQRFGSIEGHFAEALYIDETGHEELRHTLAES